MITAVIGDCGSGKTLYMTYCAYIHHKSYGESVPIYANFGLHIPYIKLTEQFFKDFVSFPIYDALVLFDEFSMYYNSRNSISKQNKQLTPFIVQTRKNSLNMVYTAQQLRLVDVNARQNTDYFVYPKMFVKRIGYPLMVKPPEWKHNKDDKYILTWEKYNKSFRKLEHKILNFSMTYKMFKKYNTKEIIMFKP